MSIKELEILKKMFDNAKQNANEMKSDPYFVGVLTGINSCIKAIEKANNEEIEAMAALEPASERLDFALKEPDFKAESPKEFLKSMIGDKE